MVPTAVMFSQSTSEASDWDRFERVPLRVLDCGAGEQDAPADVGRFHRDLAAEVTWVRSTVLLMLAPSATSVRHLVD